MQNEKLRGVLVDAKAGKVRVTSVIDTLEELYKLIECDYIDIVRRKIGGRYYDIVCDDEGLYKAETIPTGVSEDGMVMLYGNLFICSNDGNGELESLNDSECRNVLEKAIRYCRADKGGNMRNRAAVIMDW